MPLFYKSKDHLVTFRVTKPSSRAIHLVYIYQPSFLRAAVPSSIIPHHPRGRAAVPSAIQHSVIYTEYRAVPYRSATPSYTQTLHVCQTTHPSTRGSAVAHGWHARPLRQVHVQLPAVVGAGGGSEDVLRLGSSV